MISTDDTTCLISAKLVFRRKFCMPYDLLFDAFLPPWTIDDMVDVVDHLHNIRKYSQHLKLASDSETAM
jgi:hypothetical protein